MLLEMTDPRVECATSSSDFHFSINANGGPSMIPFRSSHSVLGPVNIENQVGEFSWNGSKGKNVNLGTLLF